MAVEPLIQTSPYDFFHARLTEMLNRSLQAAQGDEGIPVDAEVNDGLRVLAATVRQFQAEAMARAAGNDAVAIIEIGAKARETVLESLNHADPKSIHVEASTCLLLLEGWRVRRR